MKKGTQLIASYTYDPVGIRTRVDFGNSTWQTFNYDTDPRYRLDNIHYAYNCGSEIADQGGLKFARDKAGNPLTWGDIAGFYTRAYAYDKNSRLDSANLPGNPTVDYVYDWVGNRTSPGGMQYNAADQLTSWPGQHSYEYWGDGSLRYQKDGGGVTQKTYSYTPAGLLSSVAHAGAGTSSMTWDAGANRIGFTSSTGGTYTFVYDMTAGIPAVTEEVTPTGSVYYIREPSGALIARVAGSDTLDYHFDDLGSTLFLTDSAGVRSDEYTYDAWGNLTSRTGSTNQPYQYVGQLGHYTHYQDANLPLLQLGVRFYDAETGRFTQEDSSGDGINWYLYATGNPASFIDPQGEMAAQLAASAGVLMVVPEPTGITKAAGTGVLVAAGLVGGYELVKNYGPAIVHGASSMCQSIGAYFAKPSKRSRQKEDKCRQNVGHQDIENAARDIEETGEKMSDALRRLKNDPKWKPRIKDIEPTIKKWMRKGQ